MAKHRFDDQEEDAGEGVRYMTDVDCRERHGWSMKLFGVCLTLFALLASVSSAYVLLPSKTAEKVAEAQSARDKEQDVRLDGVERGVKEINDVKVQLSKVETKMEYASQQQAEMRSDIKSLLRRLPTRYTDEDHPAKPNP